MKYSLNQKRAIWSGILWSSAEGFTAFFLTAFALVFGATNAQIGIIASIPYLAVILTEIPGAKLMDFFPRKSITVVSIAFSRISWFLVILVPFLFEQSPVYFIILFYFLIKLMDLISDPPWVSLLADIVPEKSRGEYFGYRAMVVNSFSSLAALIGGFYLDFFPKENLNGFLSLFSVGVVLGVATSFAFNKIKDPRPYDGHRHSLKDFLSLRGELRSLCISAVCFNFATTIASPFFTVYMLKNLEMSYSLFVLATVLSTVTKIVSHPHIGRISDKYGDKPVAIISTMATAFVPLAFFFINKENIWLIIPAQIVSGLAWAGVDLSVFNLLLDKSNIDRRGIDIAEYNTITSVPMIIGPIVGGYIADNIVFIVSGIPLLFLIAFVLRLISSFTLFYITETRVKKSYQLRIVFRHLVAIHPLKELEHSFKVLKKGQLL